MVPENFYVKLAKFSSIVMILPSSMAAGWLLGYFGIDRWFGIYPWGTILFIMIGAGAGFYEIIRTLAVTERNASGKSADKQH
jgi:F0F1-type ATP synthase assembly protein I